MKKLIYLMMLIFCAGMIYAQEPTKDTAIQAMETLKSLNPQWGAVNFEFDKMEPSPVPNFYQARFYVKQQDRLIPVVVYISKDSKILFLGQVINLTEKKNLTQDFAGSEKYPPIDMSKIDLNNGAGFSPMTTNNYTAANLAAALNGITIIDASKGFKLKLKITTVTTNTTAITYLYLTTISTDTAQDYQYPLDTVQVKTTVVDASTSLPIQGAHVYIVAAAGGSLNAGTVILDGYTDASGISLNSSFELSGANQPITGRVRKSSSSPYYKTSPIAGNITNVGFDTTLFMILDE